MNSFLRISLIIILTLIIFIVALVLANKLFEQQSIKKIAGIATMKLEDFLEEYQKDEKISANKYNISKYHEFPKFGYDRFLVEIISSKNISESELNIEIKHKVRLFYGKKKINYIVTHGFATFSFGKTWLTKKDIENGAWVMEWDTISE